MGLFDFVGRLFGGGSDGASDSESATDDGGSTDVPDRPDSPGSEAGEPGDDPIDGPEGNGDDAAGRHDAPSGSGGTGDSVPVGNADDAEVPIGEIVAGDRAEIREQAEEHADFWGEFGLDFTPESLTGLDEMFASQQARANWMQVEYDDGRVGRFAPIASGSACYFGEVMVRNYGVEWVDDESAGWALDAPGGERVDVFTEAHRALDGDPPFVTAHDRFLERFGLDGDRIGDGTAAGSDDAEPPEAGDDAEPVDATDDGEPVDATDDADRDGRRDVDRSDDGVDPGTFDGDRHEPVGGKAIEELVADYEAEAQALVGAWPEYDLDFSPDSLDRLDDLVESELRREEFQEAALGSTDDDASTDLTVHAIRTGAYFAEVFRRTTDADWGHTDDHGFRLEFPGTAADARVDPIGIAERRLRGEVSFADRYETTVAIMGEIGAVSDDGGAE